MFQINAFNNRKMGTIRTVHSNIIISIYKNALIYMLIQSFECIFLNLYQIKNFLRWNVEKKIAILLYLLHMLRIWINKLKKPSINWFILPLQSSLVSRIKSQK